MTNNCPIGIFDSGVGGLSVFRELVKVLPNEDLIYVADSENCPYGNKSKSEVIELSERVVKFLLKKGCKLIVVACNTATASAIDYLRSNYDIPFIGMEPAVKPASLNSKTKSVGILATEGTFNGKLYRETSKKYASDISLNIIIGNELVGIVENDIINKDKSIRYLKNLISPLVEKNIDHLVLGCTHYPFLIPVLKQILPSNVEIIDPAPAVVKQTKKVLDKFSLLNSELSDAKYEFYSSGDSSVLKRMVSNIMNQEYDIEKI